MSPECFLQLQAVHELVCTTYAHKHACTYNYIQTCTRNACVCLLAYAAAQPTCTCLSARKQDRTGVIVLLLLLICEVPGEAIVADYAQSEVELRRYRQSLGLQDPTGATGAVIPLSEIIIASTQETLRAVLVRHAAAAMHLQSCLERGLGVSACTCCIANDPPPSRSTGKPFASITNRNTWGTPLDCRHTFMPPIPQSENIWPAAASPSKRLMLSAPTSCSLKPLPRCQMIGCRNEAAMAAVLCAAPLSRERPSAAHARVKAHDRTSSPTSVHGCNARI